MLKCSLRSTRVLARSVHCTRPLRQKPPLTDTSPGHFKSSHVSTVQEKTLFEQIFTQIMKRSEAKDKSKGLLRDALPKGDPPAAENDNLQIVFEKKKEITPENEKLLQFFKDTSGEQPGDVSDYAKLTTDDIRKYPVSLTSTYFAEADRKDSADLSASLYLDKISLDDIATVPAKPRLQVNPQTLAALETQEKLKAALHRVLEPHLDYLDTRVQTDEDCLQVIRQYLEAYASRNKDLERQSGDVLAQIQEGCRQHPEKLPQPYKTTLPFVVAHLFTSADYDFPIDRKYNLLSLIYNEAKKSRDVSLYLNVCNVGFYNLLLRYSWKNFQEIHQLRQLVTEMSVNGIMGDVSTVEILDGIVRDMRCMNDGVLDEALDADSNGGHLESAATVGVVWCRENTRDLEHVENYLAKLKESQL